MANKSAKTVITAIETEAVQSNNESEIYTSKLPPSPTQLSVLSGEAAPVHEESIANLHNTENAEHPSFRTINSHTPITQLTPPFYLDPKSPDTLHTEPPIPESKTEIALQNISTKTPLATLPITILTRIQPAELVPPQGVLIQVLFAAGSTPGETPTSFSTLSQAPLQSHNRSPEVAQPPTKNQSVSISPEVETTNRNIYVALPGASITPPLTHSSSFESAIEFWRRQISTSDIIPSPELSPYTAFSDTGAPLPISTPPKCKK